MGIIQSQSIKGTVYIYLGLIIGFITSALVYPEYLTTDEIGLLAILLSYSLVFSQFASLGTSRIAILAFPVFQDKNKHHHGLLSIITLISVIGLVLSLIILFLIRPALINNAKDPSGLFSEYFIYLVPMIFFNLAFLLYDNYYKVLMNTVRGTMMKEFVQRVLILVFVIFFIFKVIGFREYVILYVVAMAVPPVFLLIKLIQEKEFSMKPDISFLNKDMIKFILDVGLYGILAGFSAIIITNVDRILIERLLGLGATGIYTTVSFFAALIVMPSRALYKIADPIIAQSWKRNDLKHISYLYERSTLNQFLIGLLLFVGIWANVNNIFRILPEEFVAGKWVILFLGLTFLSDMLSGLAWFIISGSKHYRLLTYHMILLIALIIISNLILIPLWGLTGSAIATFISKIIYNLVMYLFLLRKYKLQPYHLNHLWILIIGLLAYLVGFIIPGMKSLILDIVIRSIAMTTVFAGLIYYLKISTEFNEKTHSYLNFILKYFR